MAGADTVTVEVAWAAGPDDQIVLVVTLPAGAGVEQAIHASGILARCPQIDLATARVGIFSRLVTLDTALRDGDRVEIYRTLKADPKAARRARAARR